MNGHPGTHIFLLRGPDKLFNEYRFKDVSFIKPIHNLRDFEIEDADGYVLFFGRPNP
jgi:hypothetical protein